MAAWVFAAFADPEVPSLVAATCFVGHSEQVVPDLVAAPVEIAAALGLAVASGGCFAGAVELGAVFVGSWMQLH